MKTIRACLLSAAACGCLCSFANPVVTVDHVQQRYPWNGLVDIDYTIANFTGDEVDYQLAVDLVMTGATQRVYSFANYAPCDAPITNGTHRLTWNAPADGVERLERNASIIIRLVYAPTTERDADYLIIDVSGGTEAATYPVKFVKGGEPRQFNSVRYQSDRIVLKRVPAGSFWMGTGKNNNGDVSLPTSSRHYVTLTKDFFLGLFPITQRQHELVTGSRRGGTSRVVSSEGPVKPTFDWTYDQIMGTTSGGGFFTNLCAKTVCRGIPVKGFTLPTEAQREYACRAGTTNSYVYGSNSTNLLERYAYYAGNCQKWGSITWGDDSGSYYPLTAAGSFLPNAWGFYGMQSLVSEWCSDWDGSYPTSTEEEPDIDPTGPATGTKKVLRGGNLLKGTVLIHSGARFSAEPTYNREGSVHSVFGFRIMKYVP